MNKIVPAFKKVTAWGFPGGPVVKNPPWGKKKKRICLAAQVIPVRSLVQEDPTCCGATEPMCPNYGSPCARELCSTREAHTLQLELPPLATTRESLGAAMKTQHSQLINYLIKIFLEKKMEAYSGETDR